MSTGTTHDSQHTIDYKDQINDFMVRHFVKPE
jgi:hypothetical protein